MGTNPSTVAEEQLGCGEVDALHRVIEVRGAGNQGFPGENSSYLTWKLPYTETARDLKQRGRARSLVRS